MIVNMADAKRKSAPSEPLELADATYARRTITIPRPVEAEIQEKVGHRGFSAFVTSALTNELQRQRLTAWLAERIAENGPIPEEDLRYAEELARKVLSSSPSTPAPSSQRKKVSASMRSSPPGSKKGRRS